MNEADAIDLVQFTIWTVIVASGPSVGAAMLIGTVIAFAQALTQVQEVTLTFVPKIIAIFIVAVVTAHYMGASVFALAHMSYSRIESGF